MGYPIKIKKRGDQDGSVFRNNRITRIIDHKTSKKMSIRVVSLHIESN